MASGIRTLAARFSTHFPDVPVPGAPHPDGFPPQCLRRQAAPRLLQRQPRRTIAHPAAVDRGRTGRDRRPDAGARRLRPHRRPPQRGRLLPSRPPADLPRDPRTGREEPALRCRHPGRMVRVSGSGGTGRRRRLSGRAGQHHALGRQHHRLRRDRPRQGDPAPADRSRHRHRQRRLRARGPRQRRDPRQGRKGRVRDLRSALAGPHRLRRHQQGDGRSLRRAADPLPERQRHHWPADRLHRIRRDDRRPAADRSGDPGRAPGDGQDHVRAEHRRARRDQDQETGRGVLDGNVGLAAGAAPDLRQWPRQRHPPAHRPARGRGLEPGQRRDPHDQGNQDLHRRYAGPIARGPAREVAPPQARTRPGPDRHRLPAADGGTRQQREPRDRNLRDLALAQGTCEGTQRPGDRAFAAQSLAGNAC